MVCHIANKSRLGWQVFRRHSSVAQITLGARISRTMSSYTSDWPVSINADTAYKTFFEKFYEISDTPSAHDKYTSQFTKDATFILGSQKAFGSDEIRTLRRAMWEKVSSRKHCPIKIFPFGNDSDEVMLYGTVEYEFKTGQKSDLDWAAHARLSKAEGDVKMSFYQVYLDTGAQSSK